MIYIYWKDNKQKEKPKKIQVRPVPAFEDKNVNKKVLDKIEEIK